MSNSEPPQDVSKDELWNRLRRLEKKVFPNRRDLLKAGAVGAAGAAVGFGSGTASAQTASGQVGTASNPVDVEGAAVNADELSLTNSILVTTANNGNGVTESYPPTAAGLSSAFDDVEAGAAGDDAAILIPPGQGTEYDLGTSTWDFSVNSVKISLIGTGPKRDPVLRWGRGVGTGITTQGDDRFKNIEFGRKDYANATEDDTAVHCSPGSGFTTFRDCTFQGWWRSIFLDGHFNSRIIDCDFSKAQSGTAQGAGIYTSTANGSIDDTYIRGCFFGEPETPAIWNDANQTTISDIDIEGAGDEAIRVEFGDNFKLSGLTVSRTLAGAGDMINVSGGSGIISDVSMEPGSGDYGTGITINHNGGGASDGPWKVSDVDIFSPGSYGVQVTVPECDLSNVSVDSPGYACLGISADDVTVDGGTLKNANQSGSAAYDAGVYLDGCVDCSIVGVRAFDDQSTATQNYGVKGASSDYNTITGCPLRGNATGGTTGLGASTVTAGNVQ